MDLLRLALERAKTAQEAIDVITGLLKQYGEKANANMLMERTYENSFILVDTKECWVLETAGREWAAKQIKTKQGVSNCYSIRTEMDRVSENAEKIAREKRWLNPEEPFDFAKAYTGRLVSQPFGLQRYRRLNKLLEKQNVHDFGSLSSILRDHFDDEIIEPRFGETVGTFMSVCMHMRDWGESEKSASLLAYYDEKIGIIGRYAPVQPCLSAYIPVYMTGKLPEKMERAEKRFDEESLWWQVKRLSLLVTVDERIYMDEVRAKLQALEIQFTKEGEKAEDEARQLIDKGMQDEAKAVLFSVTEKCTEMLYDFAKAEGKRIANSIQAKGGLYGRQKEAIEKYVAYAEIPLFYER